MISYWNNDEGNVERNFQIAHDSAHFYQSNTSFRPQRLRSEALARQTGPLQTEQLDSLQNDFLLFETVAQRVNPATLLQEMKKYINTLEHQTGSDQKEIMERVHQAGMDESNTSDHVALFLHLWYKVTGVYNVLARKPIEEEKLKNLMSKIEMHPLIGPIKELALAQETKS